MEKKNELGVIIKCRKLIEYIFTVTEKSPKKYYLDGLDRLVKESYRIKYFTRYMADCIII